MKKKVYRQEENKNTFSRNKIICSPAMHKYAKGNQQPKANKYAELSGIYKLYSYFSAGKG